MATETKQDTSKPAAPAEDANKNLPAERTTGTALAVVDIDQEDYSGGLKNITNDERKIPFVRLLQSNSPECEEGGTKYLPNAKAGLLINTASKQLYSKLIFIPCARDHKYLEYIPRDAGGGFVGVRKPDDEVVLMLRTKQGKFGKLQYNVTKRNAEGKPLDGTEITETYEVYSIFIDPETGQKFRGILTFQSTQIGKYQVLVDRADNIEYQSPDGKPFTPPFWAHRWVVTAGNEKNKKGSFKGYVIGLEAKKPDGSDDVPIKSLVKKSDPLYAMGKDFAKFVEAGQADVDYKEAGAEEAEAKDEIEM